MFGAILPGYFSYLTAAELPAGVRSIIIAIVPMFVLPIALALGFERPDARRAAGVALGAAAIAAISLPGGGAGPAFGVGVVLLALIAPISYAVEANFLAWRGAERAAPVPAAARGLAGRHRADLAAGGGRPARPSISAGPGGRRTGRSSRSGVLNALAYSGYVWLVGRAGSVFASQIAYLVTAFGVVWSMLLLGERYSGWLWLAFALMLAGVALVQPRTAAANPP